jgi:hypothetical protein
MGLFATRKIPRGTRILCETPAIQIDDPKATSGTEYEIGLMHAALDERTQFYVSTLSSYDLTRARLVALREVITHYSQAQDRQFYLDWPTSGYRLIDAPQADVWRATRTEPWPETWPEDWVDSQPWPDFYLIDWEDEAILFDGESAIEQGKFCS